jgi:hypothetical protein
MPSTSAPFGLRPVNHVSGAPVRLEEMTIASAYASNIFEGTPVKIGTDGTIQVAAAGDRLIGSFRGCEYTTSDGRRVVTNRWVASTALASGTTCIARVTRDPEIIYEIQGGSIALADIGTMADHSGVSGDSTTGLSSTILDTVSASVEAQYQVVGISKRPDNAAGDTYTLVYVKIAEHQDRAIADAAQAF